MKRDGKCLALFCFAPKKKRKKKRKIICHTTGEEKKREKIRLLRVGEWTSSFGRRVRELVVVVVVVLHDKTSAFGIRSIRREQDFLSSSPAYEREDDEEEDDERQGKEGTEVVCQEIGNGLLLLFLLITIV